jgi:flagellar biosynthesis protein FlhG
MTQPADKLHQGPLTVAVGGGKGGVGKTLIAANLAAAMAHLGFRVIAVDADLGSANLHTLLGVQRTRITLHALFEGRIESLEEAVIATPLQRLFLVAGTDAIPGDANLPHAQKLKLMRHIRKLDTDVVVIDCGAGVSFNVIDFFNLADCRLLVAAPQLISLQNCYGFLKASLYRAIRDRAIDPYEYEVYKAACSSRETDRVHDLIERIAEKDADFAFEISRLTDSFDASILGNQLDKPGELNSIHALSRMIRDFLSVKAPVVGGIGRTDLIHRSVNSRKPFVSDSISEPAEQILLNLAETLLTTDLAQLRQKAMRLSEEEAPSDASQTVPLHDSGDVKLLRSLTPPLAPYQRAHERIPTDRPVQLQSTRGRLPGRILDVSIKGASIQWSGTAKPGDSMLVTLLSHPTRPTLPARVARANGEIIGVEFIGAQAGRYIDKLLGKKLDESFAAISPHDTHPRA